MRDVIDQLLTDLILPLAVAATVALLTSHREDLRQARAHLTPSYDSLSDQLTQTRDAMDSKQLALDAMRKDLSQLRDERDQLARSLGDWQDWGHDLAAFWEQRRRADRPPTLPDRIDKEQP